MLPDTCAESDLDPGWDGSGGSVGWNAEIALLMLGVWRHTASQFRNLAVTR